MTTLTDHHQAVGSVEASAGSPAAGQDELALSNTLPSYFNNNAEKYTAWYYSDLPQGYALRVRQRRVLELLDKPGGKLLDVGCGPAMIAHELLASGYEVWGIDAAPRMIDLCHKQYAGMERAHFSIGDATGLSFMDGFFDAVICMGVLDRVQSHEMALKEMLRVVKPDGTLVITFPNMVSPYAAWKNYIFYPTVALLRPIYYGLARKPQPPSLYATTGRLRLQSLLTSFANMQTLKSFAGLMERNGAEVTSVAYYNLNVFLSPLDEIFPKLALRVLEKTELWRHGKLKWLGAGFIVKARRLV